MNWQFTHPLWLLALPLALGWIVYLSWDSGTLLGPWRRWTALVLRLGLTSLLVLALAGLQWKRPEEGLNVIYLLDRSDSVPSVQQEMAREFANRTVKDKKTMDRAGLVVFGAEASIESSVNTLFNVQKIQAVVNSSRTDLGAAVRLGTAAFPETGQKRLVLISDGNENLGDAMAALVAAKPLGVTIDVLPLGIRRGGDVSVQKLGLPNQVKKGQTFEAKIFAQSDRTNLSTVRLFRNEQYLGEQKVPLAPGKNLFTFPQTLDGPGFYRYEVELEAPDDPIPNNNRASSFVSVRGDPTLLVISSEPEAEASLVAALKSARLETKLTGVKGFPSLLAELQSYDAIFLSNVAAGDLGLENLRLLESAVRDFGVGLVCIGGDQAYGAGAYRGTPLETTLPVSTELDSKKVLPNGALVLVVHATEFPNGNQWARDIAYAALDALSPQDEMGLVLWDGLDRWLFPLAKVGDKKEMGRQITGMMPGDMPNFQRVMEMAHAGLQKSKANLKHMVVFSDGDPGEPSQALLREIVDDKITISTVMIGGHVKPDTMLRIADQGKGRFYDVNSPGDLPQIFIKEAAVILKSAIFEEPFKPQQVSVSELVRGLGATEYPTLRGYVATTPKPRAEMPLVSEKGDPLLAHWQYGLGRAVAFTSDAKAKWAKDWLTWGRYRQFWTQIAQWSLRRVENVDYTTDIAVDKGAGQLNVEALDNQGNYRNFLNLQAVVVSPKGERQTVRLEQKGPGRYEAQFDTRDVGAYLVNLMEMQDGRLRGSQVLGTSVNYSPEFSATDPNLNLLSRLAETGAGRVLSPQDPTANPFLHDRIKTYQPVDLWEWLLKLAILLFQVDVGVRRIQLDWEEWRKASYHLRRWLFFWQPTRLPAKTEESLAALLAKRDQVRTLTGAAPTATDPALFQPQQPESELPDLPRTSGPPEKLSPGPFSGTKPAAETGPAPAPEVSSRAATTQRLLEAKRRAQKRLDSGHE